MTHLDTTFLVDAMRESRRGVDGPARRWLTDPGGAPLAVSNFVLCELLVGAELHAEAEAERRRVRETCGGLPVVAPDERLPDTFARIHGALTHDAALLTANDAHFARVPGLRVLSYR